MSPDWMEGLLWSVLFTAWAQVRSGNLTRHDATTLCLSTLRKVVAPH
jgi:hypothetical protein